MNLNDGALIQSQIQEVTDNFPFKNYLNEDFKEEAGALVKLVAKALSGRTGKLLDIGSGPVNFTAVFSQVGFECCAVDDLNDPWHLLGDNVSVIKEYASKMKIKFHRQAPGDYSIPFEKGSFDVVMLNAVIEHLHESPRELLNTAFDFCKTAGIVVVTMPNSVNLRKRLSVLLGKTNYPDIQGFYHSKGTWRGHVREYTLAETAYILTQAGGEIVLADTFHLNVRSKLPNPILRKIYEILTAAIPSLRDGLIVIARKPSGWTPDVFKEDDYWESISKYVPQGVLPTHSL